MAIEGAGLMARYKFIQMRIVRDEDAPPAAFQRNFREDILDALQPGIMVQRYGRTWRLSQPQLAQNRYLWGKFGFVRKEGDTQVTYDETTFDFVPVEGSDRQGDFSYYVLDLSNQYLIFRQTSDIIPNSFLGALRKLLLEEANPEFHFDAGFITNVAEFSTWLNGVDRLERVFVSVRQPNAHFDQRYEAVRDFVGDTNAARASVEIVAAKEGESLELEDTDMEAFVEYAGQEESGVIKATGTIGGSRTTFDSERALRTRDVELDGADTEQTMIQKFINALQSLIA